jgi:hypothetical protein
MGRVFRSSTLGVADTHSTSSSLGNGQLSAASLVPRIPIKKLVIDAALSGH